MKNLKTITSLILNSVCLIFLASSSFAFDAGTSDPNAKANDELPGSVGCKLHATYLVNANNLTELVLIDHGANPASHHYRGIYYRSPTNTWSADENVYYSVTAPDARIVGDLLSYSDAYLANLCGWTTAKVTDLAPSSTFGNGSFANADTASLKIDFTYQSRTYVAIASISGGSGDFASVSSTFLGTRAAPTALILNPERTSLTVSFTPPVNDLPSDPNETANEITGYEYELNGSGVWTDANATSSPIRIDGLNDATSYSVRIRAINGVGAGVASLSSSISTMAFTAEEKLQTLLPEFEKSINQSIKKQLGYQDRALSKVTKRALNRFKSRIKNQNTSDKNNIVNSQNGSVDFYKTEDFEAAKINFNPASKNNLKNSHFSAEIDYSNYRDGERQVAVNLQNEWDFYSSLDQTNGFFLGFGFSKSEGVKTSNFNRKLENRNFKAGAYRIKRFSNGVIIDGYAAVSFNQNDYYFWNDSISASANLNTPFYFLGLNLSEQFNYGDIDINPNFNFRYAQAKNSAALIDFYSRNGHAQDQINITSYSYSDISLSPEFVWNSSILFNDISLEPEVSLAPNFQCKIWQSSNVNVNCSVKYKFAMLQKFNNDQNFKFEITHNPNDTGDTVFSIEIFSIH